MTPVNATWTSWPRCRAADNGPLRTPKLIEKCSVKPSAEDRELRWNTGYTSVREAGLVPTRKAMVGALKAGLIVMAVFADRIAPYSYDESVPGSRKKPPSVRFMGTDNIGRDMWSRAVRHARRLSTAGRRQDSQPLGPIRPTTERDGVQGRAASGLTGRARAWRTGWAAAGRPWRRRLTARYRSNSHVTRSTVARGRSTSRSVSRRAVRQRRGTTRAARPGIRTPVPLAGHASTVSELAGAGRAVVSSARG